MAEFTFKQTVSYYLTVEADTQEQADAIASETDLYADTVRDTGVQGWEVVE